MWWKPLYVDQKSIVTLSYVYTWKYVSADYDNDVTLHRWQIII